MPKYFNQGSQTRKFQCPCGYYVEGSIRESNMKLKLHNKKCEFGKNTFNIPKFNFENAEVNGILSANNSNIRHAIAVSDNGFNVIEQNKAVKL